MADKSKTKGNPFAKKDADKKTKGKPAPMKKSAKC